jgi:hypothetical protein
MRNFIKKILLQVKTPKWIDIILVFIIVIEACYLFYLKIEFLNKNSGAIQAALTFVLIITTGYFSYRNYKSEQIRLKQPHSERIGEEIQKFLEELNDVILDPRDLKENFTEYIPFSKFLKKNFPHYSYQHLQSGYPEIYEKYNEWYKSVNSFNRELVTFVLDSVAELNEWIKREIKKDNLKYEVFYNYRIISYCFKKVLILGFPDPEHSKTSFEELQKDGSVELTWHGATIIKGNLVLVDRLENEFIKNFIISNKEKIEDFYVKFETLKSEYNKICEEIKIKIVDVAKHEGIIKGNCDVCK